MKREDFMSEIDTRSYLTQEYLKEAAAIVKAQLREHPFIGIPVDPDVADHLGAFRENALSIDDVDDVEYVEEQNVGR